MGQRNDNVCDPRHDTSMLRYTGRGSCGRLRLAYLDLAKNLANGARYAYICIYEEKHCWREDPDADYAANHRDKSSPGRRGRGLCIPDENASTSADEANTAYIPTSAVRSLIEYD